MCQNRIKSLWKIEKNKFQSQIIRNVKKSNFHTFFHTSFWVFLGLGAWTNKKMLNTVICVVKNTIFLNKWRQCILFCQNRVTILYGKITYYCSYYYFHDHTFISLGRRGKWARGRTEGSVEEWDTKAWSGGGVSTQR